MINFLGDVYLDKAYKLNIELNNIIFNLEYPISSRGIPLKDKVILHQNKSFIKETFNCNPLAGESTNPSAAPGYQPQPS